MKDIIRHILKEDKKGRFINAILNDMINKTEFKYKESGGKEILSVRLFTDKFFGSFYVLGQSFRLGDRFIDRYNISKEEDVSNRTIDLTKEIEERERYIYEIYHDHNIYGINFNTFEGLYKRYIDEVVSIIKEKIKPNQNINESMEDKRDKFIEVIVDDLISKSIIEYDKRKIIQPSGFYVSFGDLDSRIRDKRINSPSSMKDYIKHYYQLNNEYTFKVFKLYLVALKDKITKPLNESENKRDRFLQFIIDDLVSKTKISDDDGIKVKFNFLKKYGFVNVAPIDINLIYKPSVEGSILYYFSLYCKDVYGLSSSDIEFVWLEYKGIVKDKINSKDNINESENKRDRFLNYVINDLVGKTDWWDNNTTVEGWGEKNVRIYTPFIDDWITTFALRAANQHQIPFIFSRIKEYCKKMYGSSDEEVMEILDSYKNKVLSEIMKQYSHLK